MAEVSGSTGRRNILALGEHFLGEVPRDLVAGDKRGGRGQGSGESHAAGDGETHLEFVEGSLVVDGDSEARKILDEDV